MNTFYKADPETGRLSFLVAPFNPLRGLLDQGETIDALIDKAIEKLPEDAQGFVMEASVTPGVATVAVGFRFHNDWTVSVGADFRKDGKPAGHVEVIKTW